MKKIDLTKIKTERDLQLALYKLDRRWKATFSIEDSKKRGKEILRLRHEIKHILDQFKRRRLTANLNSNSDNFCNKIFKNIIAWLRKVEKKDRDDQRKIQNN